MDYDVFCFGDLSKDIIQTPTEKTELVGGAVLHAAWTAYALGYHIGALTKTAVEDRHLLQAFPPLGKDLYWRESTVTTSILNFYPTPDLERRLCTNLARADPFVITHFPKFNAHYIMHNGLFTKEVSLELLQQLAKKTQLGIDAAAMIRTILPDNSMVFQSWTEQKQILPLLHFFKMDAAEAAYLTGINTETHQGRLDAGTQIQSYGVREVMLTVNEEVIVFTAHQTYSIPFRFRSLKGRTGRGDTCSMAYLTHRIHHNVEESTRFAAALTSLKVEIPGPFKLNRQDVDRFLQQFYEK